MQPFIYHFETQMKSLFKTMTKANSLIQAIEISKQYSLHQVEVCQNLFIYLCLFVAHNKKQTMSFKKISIHEPHDLCISIILLVQILLS
jgi:hypothetical protein